MNETSVSTTETITSLWSCQIVQLFFSSLSLLFLSPSLHPFLSSFLPSLLSAYYLPNTMLVLGTRYILMDRINMVPHLMVLLLKRGRQKISR